MLLFINILFVINVDFFMISHQTNLMNHKLTKISKQIKRGYLYHNVPLRLGFGWVGTQFAVVIRLKIDLNDSRYYSRHRSAS